MRVCTQFNFIATRMYTSLEWLPRGVAKTKLELPPERRQEDDDDGAEAMEDEGAGVPAAAANGDAVPTSMEEDDDDDENEDGALDISSVLANDLNNLTFYKSNKDDPMLQGDDGGIYDEEELDELRIRASDAMLVATKSEEEASHLEYHLFDDDPAASDDEEYAPNTYVHHDMVLPTFPLCAAHTNHDDHNLVAVGLFTPGIDVWDADAVHALAPLASLGGYEKAKKKKKAKKPRLALKDGSHADAVLALSWNNVQTEYLASGSADNTVKIWDVESSHCACTLRHHTDKVQSVRFHPDKEDALLTGGFDKMCHVVDVRTQKSVRAWSVDADVESVHWLDDVHVLVATELGTVYIFDSREEKEKAKWEAHVGATSAVAVSRDIPGMIVTGGVDKNVKVWHLDVEKGEKADLVVAFASEVGSVFSAALCPATGMETASPFVLAIGGQKKNKVQVVDLGVEHEVVRTRYRASVNESAWKAMQRRAGRKSDKPKEAAKREQSDGEDE